MKNPTWPKAFAYIGLTVMGLALAYYSTAIATGGIAGRILGYGTLRVVGTGGTVEEFARVASPDALRDAVVRQTARASTARAR